MKEFNISYKGKQYRIANTLRSEIEFSRITGLDYFDATTNTDPYITAVWVYCFIYGGAKKYNTGFTDTVDEFIDNIDTEEFNAISEVVISMVIMPALDKAISESKDQDSKK